MKLIEGFRLRNVMGEPTIIGEGVAQVDFNKLITLNHTAAYLWEQLQGKEFDVTTVAAVLKERYGISEETAAKDAEAICRQWLDNGLAE